MKNTLSATTLVVLSACAPDPFALSGIEAGRQLLVADAGQWVKTTTPTEFGEAETLVMKNKDGGIILIVCLDDDDLYGVMNILEPLPASGQSVETTWSFSDSVDGPVTVDMERFEQRGEVGLLSTGDGAENTRRLRMLQHRFANGDSELTVAGSGFEMKFDMDSASLQQISSCF